MPFQIGSISIPFHGKVFFYYDPLGGTFGASREDKCPPNANFRLTLTEALKLVEPKY